MARYWQGELHKHCELYDCDFPQRATATAAEADVVDRLGSLTEREREAITGHVSEWQTVGDGLAESTGDGFEVLYPGAMFYLEGGNR